MRLQAQTNRYREQTVTANKPLPQTNRYREQTPQTNRYRKQTIPANKPLPRTNRYREQTVTTRQRRIRQLATKAGNDSRRRGCAGAAVMHGQSVGHDVAARRYL